MDPATAVSNPSTEEISQNMKTWRNISIEIFNCSEKYTLANPRTYTRSGYCFHPPRPTVAKNTKELCCFSKSAFTARGAVGVLTYQIFTDEKHSVGDLAIMFSVPNDYNLFENWFALGIYEEAISCDEALFKQLYYDTGPFTRSRGTGNAIRYSGKAAMVRGTMSAAGQSVMKVEFQDA